MFVANIANINWGLAGLNLSKLAILMPILCGIAKLQYKSSWDNKPSKSAADSSAFNKIRAIHRTEGLVRELT